MARQKGAAPTRQSTRIRQRDETSGAVLQPPAPAPAAAPAVVQSAGTKKQGRPSKAHGAGGRPQSSRIEKPSSSSSRDHNGNKSKATGRKQVTQSGKGRRPKKRQPAKRPGNNPSARPSEYPGDSLNHDSNNDVPDRPQRIIKRFLRSQLQAGGGLEWAGAQLPTLDNEVHPIWHFDRFTFLQGSTEQQNYEAYAAFLPALRLASLWITEPDFEEFWISLWNPSGRTSRERKGDFQQVRKTGDMHLVAQAQPGIWGTAEQQTERLHKHWDEFIEKSDFEWMFRHLPVPPFAATVDRHGFVIPGEEDIVIGQVATILHEDLLSLSRRPHVRSTNSEKPRFQIFFAVILCRELVQNIYWTHWYSHTASGNIEPSVDSSMLYKFGANEEVPYDVAWEKMMFSGVIHQISPPNIPMAPDGLAIRLNQLEECYEALWMKWINDQFSSSVWRDGVGHRNRKVVAIRRAREPAVVGGRDPFLSPDLDSD